VDNSNILLIARESLFEKLQAPLSARGWSVEPCPDVRKAVETTIRSKPELVLCEADMPIMTGWELARLFKSHDDLSQRPFLLLSAKMPPLQEMERADFRIAADDLLQLPADASAVVQRIADWLSPDERPSNLAQRMAGPLVAPPGTRASVSWRRGKVLPASWCRLLLHLIEYRETGVLRLRGERRQLKMLVQSRFLVEIESNYERDSTFGRYLAQLGVIAEADGDKSFAAATERGVTQAEALVQLGLLTPSQADHYVARQKVDKVLQTFTPVWTGSAFHFSAERLAPKRFSIDPEPLVEILKQGVMQYAEPTELAQILLRIRGEDAAFQRAEKFERIVQDLRLTPELATLAEELAGKTLVEVRAPSLETNDARLRLAFLLTAAGAVRLEAATAKTVAAAPAEPAPTFVLEAPGDERFPAWDLEAYQHDLMEGRTLFQREDYRGAQHFLDKALEINRDSSEGLALKAWCSFEMAGRQDISATYAAKELLKQAITLDDTNDEAYMFLGRIFKFEGKYGLAGVHFRRANEINPANEEARREVKLLQVKKRRAREWERR
jgi:DNA-binding response OmpR family regulator/Flp pilus assembly protein TadD